MNAQEKFKEDLKQVVKTLSAFNPIEKSVQNEVTETCTMINEMLSKLYPDDIDMANKVVMYLTQGYIDCISLSGDTILVDARKEI